MAGARLEPGQVETPPHKPAPCLDVTWNLQINITITLSCKVKSGTGSMGINRGLNTSPSPVEPISCTMIVMSNKKPEEPTNLQWEI